MSVGLSKEEFVECMKTLEEMDRDFAKIEDAVGCDLIDGKLIKPIYNYATLLKKVMNDKYDYISEFAWTLDFGKDYYDGYCTDATTGKIYSFATAEDIFDRIVEVNQDSSKAVNSNFGR